MRMSLVFLFDKDFRNDRVKKKEELMRMKRFFCDNNGCKKEMRDGVSGVIVPGIDEKEFCCYRCAQQYMEEMEGKEQIKEYFCEKCGEKLGPDYCKFATEIGDYRGTFFSGHDVKFCSIKCMIEWTKKDRRGVSELISKKAGCISLYSYWNFEIGHLGSWQIQKEEDGFYVKPEVWNEVIRD